VIVVFSVIGAIPGPVIGIILMVTLASSIPFVHALSGIIYAVAVPYSVIGLTLLYLDLTGRSLTPRRSVAARKADAGGTTASGLTPQLEGRSTT
jgi:putative effector of murein hydrolase LrgA (UPF0299 family)